MNDIELKENILDLTGIADLGFETLENLIDPFLDSALSAIPIVGLVKGIVKTGVAVREKHLLKKTLTFMKQLDISLSEKDLILFNEYREKILSKDKYTIDELDRVLFILDKTVEIEKAKYIANAFYFYIDQRIDRNAFLEMITVLDTLMTRDLDVVRLLIRGNTKFENNAQKISRNRLIAAGVVNQESIDETDDELHNYGLSKLGKAMGWFLLKEPGAPETMFTLYNTKSNIKD